MSVSIGRYRFSLATAKNRLSFLLTWLFPKSARNIRQQNAVQKLAQLGRDLKLSTPIRIVDVGANPLGAKPPYQNIIDAGLCDVIGFEPQKEAMEALQQMKGPRETYLDAAIGDGKTHRFYSYTNNGLSSTFPLLKECHGIFPWLIKGGEVASVHEITTRRLDDLEEIGVIDFLKIDIQGGELAAFQNGRASLSQAIMVQTELPFIRMYEGQPSFGDVDAELTDQGFYVHCRVDEVRHITLPNSQYKWMKPKVGRQLLDEDYIYVRDLIKLENLEPEQLKKLAILANGAFFSPDLTVRCIDILAEGGHVPHAIAAKYRESLPAKYKREPAG